MGIPYFNGEQIATDGYLYFGGTSKPRIVSIPRLSGVMIQETGSIARNIVLRAYFIKSDTSSRSSMESFQHSLTGLVAGVQGTLVINNNTYANLAIESINPVPIDHSKYSMYDINFLMGESASAFDQKDVELQDFTRGSKGSFQAIIPVIDELRTFYFWHHLYATISSEYDVTIQNSNSFDLITSITSVQGGLISITCNCWLLGPDDNTRQALEAYCYNIINGPLGLIGNLTVSGNTYPNCFFRSFSMNNDVDAYIKYTLSFIKSIC